ncbi:hypothetical protein FHR83_006287 [Actinoplanes campanulatus]|uniref:Leucine Rich repeat-containing protein n=1 Tax=Actinoplanes campanulatus TaxID=113559 RepID=A0A7W5FHE6_9ACTN|nr:hypothetical protein [Actinoplanes campanulatus]MBB3098588.1 hypothetical protein [Actinoplanes campanulatus]GGN36012.1 hypothetical protein GCM10010109_60560 [Actinoplanes campanulatus]GID39279.1 hypothetical protein Aca09nite_57850 [Actinoplanes campanulatus]
MTDIERAVAELVTIGMLDAGTPTGEVRDLVVSHARSLDGLEAYAGLETLSLIGCAAGDYRPLSGLAALRVLTVENSDLADVNWASGMGLRVVVLRRDRLRDARAMLDLPELQSLDLTGNPLDAEALAAAAALGGPGRLVTLDDEETAALNRALAGTGVVAYRTGGELWACATGLDLTEHPEAGHARTTAGELRAVAAGTLAPRDLLGLGSA